MINNNTLVLLKEIFQEAHVIDLDFSEWDKYIRLVAVGNLLGDCLNSASPIYQIDFVDVSFFSWKSNHLGIQLDSDDMHCQWVIMDSEINPKSELEIKLISVAPPCPEVDIICRLVKISELDDRKIDSINTEWNKPYQPLIRRSIEFLSKLIRENKKQRERH